MSFCFPKLSPAALFCFGANNYLLRESFYTGTEIKVDVMLQSLQAYGLCRSEMQSYKISWGWYIRWTFY